MLSSSDLDFSLFSFCLFFTLKGQFSTRGLLFDNLDALKLLISVYLWFLHLDLTINLNFWF